MKKLCAKLISVLVLACTVLTVPPVIAADPAVRVAGLPHQAETFSKLLRLTEATVTETAAITPSDKIATGTLSTAYYLPDSVEYPILLRVQNLGSDEIRYSEYETVGTAGVTLPTASSPQLLATTGALCKSGLAFEKVFYHSPTLVFSSASGSQDIVVEVWGRKNTE